HKHPKSLEAPRMVRRHSVSVRQSTLLLTAAVLSACGGHMVNSGSKHGSSDASASDQELVEVPPRGYYDALVANTMQLIDNSTTNASGTTATPVAPTPAAAAAPATTPAASSPAALVRLWINFDGATVKKGYDAGSSFLLCKDSVTIAPIATLSDGDKASIVAGVQGYFTAAKVALEVTATKPSSGSFTTIEVGGSLADLGCADHGEYGASPLDLGNANKNDIAFAFNKAGISDQQLAVNIAHLAGHTYGLATAADPIDIMAVSPAIDTKGFGTSPVVGSTDSQNEPEILQKAISSTTPSATTPPVETTLPPVIAAIPGIDLVIAEIAKLTGDKGLGSLLPLIKALLPIAAQIDPNDIESVLKDNGIYTAGSGNTVTNTVSGNNINITINIINSGNTTNQSSLPPQPVATDSSSSSCSDKHKERGCAWIFAIRDHIKNKFEHGGPSCRTPSPAPTANHSGTADSTTTVSAGTPKAPATAAAPADPAKTATAATPVDLATAPKIAALVNSVPDAMKVTGSLTPSEQKSVGNMLKAGCAHGYLSLVGNL
ncbi:MAG: hypothetical protein NTZ90_13330, partial [Proteobacteria bacterium]|nr:hypothetical protein [Pseudomonadota bacterium]